MTLLMPGKKFTCYSGTRDGLKAYRYSLKMMWTADMKMVLFTRY